MVSSVIELLNPCDIACEAIQGKYEEWEEEEEGKEFYTLLQSGIQMEIARKCC